MRTYTLMTWYKETVTIEAESLPEAFLLWFDKFETPDPDTGYGHIIDMLDRTVYYISDDGAAAIIWEV